MTQSKDVTARDLPPFRGRQSRRVRLLLVAAAAAGAFAVGAIVGAGSGEAPAERVASRFTTAWEHGDWARMWALSAGPNRPRASTFTARYRAAADTATVSAIAFGRPRDDRDGVVEVPAVIPTRVWGRLGATLRLPVAGEGGAARVRWSSRLVFPGLRPGERLRRETTLPARADLRFRDNTKMSRFPELSASIAGDLGAIPPDRAERMRARGIPADGLVGISGLQRVFDERMLGRPGGILYAGRRVLARAVSVPAGDVRTTIAPKVQRAAVDALAGRLGGAIALRPGSGEVLGAAGVAWSALQPPGSTFKIVTLAGVLQAGVAKASSAFPVATGATLSGVKLENANGESCGGTLLESFAESCNSVFAPLGAELGARRLVDIAQRFGFNKPSPIPGAATSTIPPASEIGDDLAVGSSAIGQGKVQATTLQMALVAAAIGNGGRLPRPRLDYVADAPRRLGRRATSAHV